MNLLLFNMSTAPQCILESKENGVHRMGSTEFSANFGRTWCEIKYTIYKKRTDPFSGAGERVAGLLVVEGMMDDWMERIAIAVVPLLSNF